MITRKDNDKITHPVYTDNSLTKLIFYHEVIVCVAKIMENQQNVDSNTAERGESRVEDLHLDRIVASQPEIGPTPPDGGYGWLIVFTAVMYHITVPALTSMYGIIILKAIREEDHERGELMKIWDVDIALVPVIAVVIRLLLESWCRAMVKIFNMPRFMALAGLCLTVAGVLLSSNSTDAESNDHIINIFSGIFVGKYLFMIYT